MQQNFTKIIKSLFLLSIGAIIGSQIILQFVIGPKAIVETPEGLAIYNLFDHAIPYTFSLIGIAFVLLITILVMHFIKGKAGK